MKKPFEEKIYQLLTEHGWYWNGGWRASADAQLGVAMPPALSAGEVVDELIRRERELDGQS